MFSHIIPSFLFSCLDNVTYIGRYLIYICYLKCIEFLKEYRTVQPVKQQNQLMKVQPRDLAIYSCSYIEHSSRVTEMNGIFEVKVLVRSASNLSGCSIKRKLRRRKLSILYSTWMEMYGCRICCSRMKTNINGEEMALCTC